MQGLLAHGFSGLLVMAGGEGVAEPWPRIHAFNALRVAFGDSCLTNVASAYFSRGAHSCRGQWCSTACAASGWIVCCRQPEESASHAYTSP